MAEIRQSIEDSRFEEFVHEFYERIGKPVPPLNGSATKCE
ncbi:hypothetical protein PROPEN_03018 [Proteus penneri ATCC 35198]|nr:hypothetical protein PROPEN_03018 [Proteus penneri ATCC 35198]